MKNSIYKYKMRLACPGSGSVDVSLLKHAKLNKEELEKLQLSKMRALVRHVKEHVPYYTRVFSEILPEDIQTLSDCEKLPILTKDDIRNHFEELISDECAVKSRRLMTTGGSTGVPLKLYHDKRFPTEVIADRVLPWWGCDPACDKAFIYRKVRTGWKASLNSIMWWPTRRIFLDASLLTTERMEDFLKKLQSIRPPLLQGYVGAVYEFAKYCEGKGIDFSFLRAVWVTSAPLSESNRHYMEGVLGAPVYDQYGCSEVFWLAIECREQKGLHVMSDIRSLEIVGEDNASMPKGEYGDIVVTDLENRAFPLIRYKNGDRGRYLKSECSCGLPFPLLDKVKGRESECLRLRDGGVIAGEFLTTIFDDSPDAVESFQIRQEADYSILLICVVGCDKTKRLICEEKRQQLSELVRGNVEVRLRFVERIDHEGGKIRYIVSNVES